MEDDEVNLYADADNGETAYTPKAKGIVAAEAENEKPEHEADELEKQLAGVGRRDLLSSALDKWCTRCEDLRLVIRCSRHA